MARRRWPADGSVSPESARQPQARHFEAPTIQHVDKAALEAIHGQEAAARATDIALRGDGRGDDPQSARWHMPAERSAAPARAFAASGQALRSVSLLSVLLAATWLVTGARAADYASAATYFALSQRLDCITVDGPWPPKMKKGEKKNPGARPHICQAARVETMAGAAVTTRARALPPHTRTYTRGRARSTARSTNFLDPGTDLAHYTYCTYVGVNKLSYFNAWCAWANNFFDLFCFLSILGTSVEPLAGARCVGVGQGTDARVNVCETEPSTQKEGFFVGFFCRI